MEQMSEMKTVMDIADKQASVRVHHAEKALNQGRQRASYILRELVIAGKLEKTGRGTGATYKKKQ